MSTAQATAARWLPVVERFFLKVASTRPDECWEWIGNKNSYGYGRFRVDNKRMAAHRWSYEHHVGPIPEGLVLDHLCRNRACVNPAHLEAVTNAENIRRGEPASRTHCPSGHEYTPENSRRVFNHKRGQWGKNCRACERIYKRELRRRGRAAKQAAPTPDREEARDE